MSLLSRLFGGGAAPQSKGQEYNGFVIYPEPIAEGSTFRVAARIEKDFAGELKVHQLIRADTIESKDAAAEASVNKAKQLIDQMSDRLFD